MAEVTDRDYAEAEKWTQDCPVCEGMEGALAKQIAAYREECVAEERAAREKAEQERDKTEQDWKRISGRWQERADGLEARLRAVIEALRAVHGECPGWIEVCGSAHDPRCDGTCSVGCPVPVQEQEKCQVCDLLGRDAQASPEPEASQHGGRDGK